MPNTKNLTEVKKQKFDIREKVCRNCLYLVQIDDGYSNWTVEGSTNHCLFNKNPKMPEDNYYKYGEDNALNYTCNLFTHYLLGRAKTNGDVRICIDVDRDKGNMINYTTNKQLIALLELNPERITEMLSWKM